MERESHVASTYSRLLEHLTLSLTGQNTLDVVTGRENGRIGEN